MHDPPIAPIPVMNEHMLRALISAGDEFDGFPSISPMI